MIERMRLVFPSQQNTYSKIDRSSFSIRLVIPWANGVNTTHLTSGRWALMARATEKASLSALPGMHITKSILVDCITSSASLIVLTWVNVGG